MIEEKAIIFFKSKYRKQEEVIIIIPHKEKAIINDDKNLKLIKNEPNINLNIPQKPSKHD